MHNFIKAIKTNKRIVLGLILIALLSFVFNRNNSNGKKQFVNTHNNDSSLPSVKILVGYHKKPKVLLKDDEVFVPIHLGRALGARNDFHIGLSLDNTAKNSSITPENFKWMKENMMGDDTRENISNKNKYYCDVTGMYWAWKNLDKLSNPDYIGFFHYRRHLFFNLENYNKTEAFEYTNLDSFYKKRLGLEAKIIKNTIKDYDVIMPLKKITNGFCHFFGTFTDIKKIKELVIKNNPEYTEALNEVYGGKGSVYCGNLFIMKTSIFKKFAEFIFKILKESEQDEDAKGAYLTEALTNIFLYKEKIENDIKILEVCRGLLIDP